MTNTNTNRIIKLNAENIKVLKAVEITPRGDVIQLTGKNGQGKSSVLDAIIMALSGKKTLPEKPVRDGEDEGNITIDLGNIIVKRRIKRTGESTIKVESKEGAVFKSPQALLDELVSNIGFDPLAFAQLKAKDQFEALRGVIKCDFDFAKSEQDYKTIFDERTTINRFAKEAEVKMNAVTITPDTPTAPVSVTELAAELQEANRFNQEQLAAERYISDTNIKIEANKRTIADLLKKIEEDKAIIAKLEAENKAAAEEIAKPEMQPKARKNTDDITSKITNAESLNTAYRRREEKATLAAEHKKYADKSAELTKRLNEITALRTEALRSVKMPVDGLTLGDNVVYYNGIPLEQCSQGEKIRISTAIAMSGAKEKQLRVVLIKDGSLLDDDNMAMIAEMARVNDYQVWIERVDSTGKVGIVIEDGTIKKENNLTDGGE